MRIAVCEVDFPTPMRDAGSRAVTDLIEGLIALGHDAVLFVEADPRWHGALLEFEPEVIILSRPSLFMRLHPVLRPLRVPIAYFAHDMHFVRIGLQSELVGDVPASTVSVLRFIEQQCFLLADLSLMPTEEEAERVRREFPGSRSIAIDYFPMSVTPRPGRPEGFRAVFVGGPMHAPNVDGVGWFLRDIWPSVLRMRPDAQFLVCGRWGERAADFRNDPGVRVLDSLPDDALDEVLGGSSVGVAPLRFGAGMKRKTLHYLSHGLPVIGTSFAVEGLAPRDGLVPGVIRADGVEEWVAAFASLNDTALADRLSSAGAAFVAEHHSRAHQLETLAEAIRQLR
jgi:glycosyltransferase involved in cell wall biosynthesis